MIQSIAQMLGVPRWLWRSVWRISLWHAVFVAAVTMTKSASNAVFLARAEPRDLPLLYVAVAILVALFTSLVAKMLAQLPVRRAFVWGVSANATLMLLSLVATHWGIPGGPALFYVFGEVTTTCSSILFWARVSEAFSVRDQKRVVGIVSAGGMAGAVVGGLAIRGLAEPIGVLLPVGAGVVGVVLAMPLFQQVRARARKAADSSHLGEGVGYLLRRRYAVGVALLVILFAATGAAVDFVFRLNVAASRNEAEMAGLFGILNAVVGVSVVAFQAGLTGRLLERIGIFAFAALVPTLLVLCAAAAWMTGENFEILICMKAIEMAGAFSIYQSAVTLLYNPMPAAVRAQVRALVDGMVKKGGAALTGLTLAALAKYRPEFIGPALVGGLATVALLELPWLRKQYLRALYEKLGRQKRRARTSSTIDTSDRVTQQVLLDAIDEVEGEQVLPALYALGADFPLGRERIARLLGHEDETVRRLILQRVDGEDEKLAPLLLRMVGSESARRPRAEAVRALARAAPPQFRVHLQSLLSDDDPGVITAAIEMGLFLNDERARARLDELVEEMSGLEAPWRREIARLLGRLDDVRYDTILSKLIEDRLVSVQQVAIEAAGREKHPAHLKQLIPLLAERPLRASVRTALANFGDDAVTEVSRTLDDVTVPLSLRIHLPRVLAEIGTQKAGQALLFSNPRDNAYLQRRIADRLIELFEKNPRCRFDRKRTDEAIRRRLQTAAAYGEIARDLGDKYSGPLRLLGRIIQERKQQNLRIAFQLLSLHRGSEAMMTVLQGLEASEARTSNTRQDALELLDASLTTDPLRAEILNLLEAKAGATSTRTPEEKALWVAQSKDPVLRGVARHSAQLLGKTWSQAPGWIPLGLGTDEVEGEDMSEELVSRLFLLEQVDIFEGISVDDLTAIASIATETKFESGQVIYREGDRGDSMFVIVEGEVMLTKNGQPVLHLLERETLGQVSFLDRGPRPVTAQIAGASPARLLVIDRSALMDLLSDRPGLMHALFAHLAQRLRTLIDRDVEHGH